MSETIKIFLSRPNPFNERQQLFLDKLVAKLKSLNMEPITLQADNYDLSDSMNYLKEMIKKCYGAIIIGFKQIFIESGTKKKGGKKDSRFFYPQEINVSGQALTSPFCHIEGTIALLNDLPLLIMNERGLREEGIVTGGKFSVKTNSFDLMSIDDFFADKIIEQQISVWIGKVIDYYLFLEMKKV